MTTPARSQLLDHPVFDGVDTDRIATLLGSIHPNRVAPGTIIEHPDSHCCTLLLEGGLHSYVILPDGRRLLLEVVGPGGIEGMLDVIAGHQGHFVETVTPSLVVVLTRDEVRELINDEPKIAVNLLQISLDHLERRERHLEAATDDQAIRRVAGILLHLTRYLVPWAKRRARVVELRPRPTHLMLGDMLGLRRETVTLQLRSLRRMGAVQPRRDHMALDQVLLRRVLEDEVPRPIPTGPERSPGGLPEAMNSAPRVRGLTAASGADHEQ